VVNGFDLLARWAPYLQSQTGRQGQGLGRRLEQ
jgi:hypothetical protein